MKKFFPLLTITFMLLSPLFTSSAAAAGHGNRGGNTPPSPTALPINNGIILLLVLGIFIGIIAGRKYKISTVKA
jgi:hypothetical protein